MKYRKKPVVIDAWKFEGKPIEGVERHTRQVPTFDEFDSPYQDFWGIRTLEGVMEIRAGDFLIKGVQGEYYPCRADIFEMTYEAVDE